MSDDAEAKWLDKAERQDAAISASEVEFIDKVKKANRRRTIFETELGMCSCGESEKAYNMMRAIVATCDRRDKTKPWIVASEHVGQVIAADTKTAANLFFYIFNDATAALLKHCGSVGGSWLTELGAEVVDLGPAGENDFDDDDTSDVAWSEEFEEAVRRAYPAGLKDAIAILDPPQEKEASSEKAPQK
jgi:hypothetical protein